MKKKTLSISLVVAIVVTMLLPMTSSAYSSDDTSIVKVANQYFYDDFSNFEAVTGVNSTGYYIDSRAGVEVKDFDGNPAIGPASDNTFLVNGPRGKSKNGTFNEYEFNIDKANFETAGNALVFSYDVYVPYSRSSKTGILSYFCVNYPGKSYNGQTMLGRGAELVTDTSGQKFKGFDTSVETTGNDWNMTNGSQDKGGSSINISIPKDEGKWFNVAMVLTYDSAKKAYISKNYVDGEPIKCSSGSNIGKVAELINIPDEAFLDNVQNKRTSFYFQIQKATNVDTSIALDNVQIYLYNGVRFENYTELSESETEIEIPTYNNCRYTSDVPENIRRGIFSTEALKADGGLKITKYSADDKFLVNGETLSGYEISSEKNVIKISNIPQRNTGEVLIVSLNGLETVWGDVSGKEVFVAPGSDFKGIVGKRFLDVSGSEIEVDDINNVSPMASTLELELEGVSGAILKSEDGTAVYTAVDGVFDFSKKPLRTNTKYTLSLDGNVYASFKTVENGALEFGEFKKKSDKAVAKYANTFDDPQEFYALVMHFDSEGKYIGGSVSKKSVNGVSSGDLEVDLNSTSDTAYSKVVLLDGIKTAKALTDVFSTNGKNLTASSATSDNKLEISLFDNSGSAAVTGDLQNDKRSRFTMLLLDADDNLIYANDMFTANDGTYTFDVNMTSDVATGTYYMYAAADGSILANGKNVYYSEDASHAIGLINGATTKEDVMAVISQNQADLEFYYDGYYDKFDDDQKLIVASIILGDKDELKKDNNEGFDEDDKLVVSTAFRKAVIIGAVSAGLIDDYAETEAKIEQLQSGTAYEWLNEDGGNDISDELRASWQTGVMTRLQGADFNSADDFINKVHASLLFECISNSDGYGNIKDMLTEYVNKGYIDIKIDYITSDVCQKLDSNKYSGFDYDKLIADIKDYYNDDDDDDEGGSKKNDNKHSGVNMSGNVTKLPDVVETPNSGNVSNEVFADIKDNWAKDIIEYLAQRNIISGKGNGEFAPSDYITKEEFTAVVARLLGLTTKTDAELNFNDVSADDWYYGVVKAAYQHGIINGVSLTEFGSGTNISRQDMAVILKNVLDYLNMEYKTESVSFADGANVADYAADAVKVLSAMSIINGYEDGTFRPSGNATRAEASKVIYELMKIINK